MATKKEQSNKPIEIIVSTYWPTRIIKQVQIINPNLDTWHNDITLSKSEAEYLYEQLDIIYGKGTVKPEDKKQ